MARCRLCNVLLAARPRGTGHCANEARCEERRRKKNLPFCPVHGGHKRKGECSCLAAV
jgi:hypothetical protein